MSDFSTLADVTAASLKSLNCGFYRGTVSSQIVGGWSSPWTGSGGGATPTSWATCTQTTVGALNSNMANQSPATIRVLKYSIYNNSQTNTWIADRLGHMGGMSGIVTTAQSTGATGNTGGWAGTRCASDYSDVEWYLEWYSNTGSTAVTATCAVTYNDGTTGNVSVAMAASMKIGNLLFIPPAVFGKWIKSVDSVTLSATTSTAGNFGVTAFRRLTALQPPTTNTQAVSADFAQLGLPQVYDNSCLSFLCYCTQTSTGIIGGSITLGVR